jgi:hypothetical protein
VDSVSPNPGGVLKVDEGNDSIDGDGVQDPIQNQVKKRLKKS